MERVFARVAPAAGVGGVGTRAANAAIRVVRMRACVCRARAKGARFARRGLPGPPASGGGVLRSRGGKGPRKAGSTATTAAAASHSAAASAILIGVVSATPTRKAEGGLTGLGASSGRERGAACGAGPCRVGPRTARKVADLSRVSGRGSAPAAFGVLRGGGPSRAMAGLAAGAAPT